MIAFKEDRQKALEDIRFIVKTEVEIHLQSCIGTTDLIGAVSTAISLGVKKGLEELIKRQYTDEDFERDLNIK